MPETAYLLIVDGERLLLDLLRREFSTIGVAVASSTDGARALLRSVRPAVLVLNVDLPGSQALLGEIGASKDPVAVIGLTDASELPLHVGGWGVESIHSKRNALEPLLSAIRGYLDHDEPAEERVEILIADDESEMRRILTSLVSSWGYTARVARNGDEVIEAVDRWPGIAVVLLDVLMPGRGGLEVLQAILEKRPDLGVILLTALSDREVARSAMRLGAFDYVTKPPDFSALETSIIACLGHREYVKRPWWKRIGQ